ncbi:MAG: hypothetical protein SVR94_15035 [Pseudomonadota bacterium]|nr:hypothetical protein [Pseudomonadota bacterium]
MKGYILLLSIISCQYCLADELERLFTTAEQRTRLNSTRIQKPISEEEEEDGGISSREVTLNGLVIRSKGPTTVWIDGQEELYQQDFTVKLDQQTGIQVPVELKGSQKTILLKPGQSVNTLNGKITQNYDKPPNQANDS